MKVFRKFLWAIGFWVSFVKIGICEEVDTLRVYWLDEVVVSATRLKTPIKRVSSSVNIVSSKQMSRVNLKGVDEALRTIPGIYDRRRKGICDIMPSIKIRGFATKQILVLVDGIPNSHWERIPIEMIDRIEVAKGAFSGLYGENAMGGIVNIITKPVSENKLIAGFESYNTRIWDLMFGDKYDKISYFLGMRKRETDGYVSIFSTTSAKNYLPSDSVYPTVTGWEKTKKPTGENVYLVGDAGKNYYFDEAYNLRLKYEITPKTEIEAHLFYTDYKYGYEGGKSYLKTQDGTIVDTGYAIINDAGTLRKLKLKKELLLSSFGGHPAYNIGLRLKNRISENIEAIGEFGYEMGNHWYSSPYGNCSHTPYKNFVGNLMLSTKFWMHSLICGINSRYGHHECEKWYLADWEAINTKTKLDYQSKGKLMTAGIYIQK